MPRMKIVCASSVLHGEEAFSTLGPTVVVPDHEMGPDHVNDADALVIRSKTRVGAELLKESRVSFVGTATAGVDHLDLDWLAGHGIATYAAAGCNANSVAEYITAALLCLVQRKALLLKDLTLGVVGVGHVGSAVAAKAEALGMRVLLNDPPRRLAEDNPPELLDLDEVLNESNVVTLHVPLTDTGPYATRHMADCRFFGKLRPGCLFLNACRGEVVDEDALMVALDGGLISASCLDVWENEPAISRDLLKRVDLGSAHIAGYSFEGKLNGTTMVYREACGFFETEPGWDPAPHLAGPPAPPFEVDARGRLDEDVLWEVVRSAYDIQEDDRLLREGARAAAAGDGAYFRALRKGYRTRREFPTFNVRLLHAEPALTARLAALGFSVIG